jgi:cytochrome P450
VKYFLTIDLAREQVFGELIAGEHTTSAALVWALKFLTDSPEVQAKVRDELYAAYPRQAKERRMPSIGDIIASKVPYLEAVIEETLRLRAAFIVPRDAVRDTVLYGHRIPKGTTVLLVAQGPDFSSPSFPVDNAERYLKSNAAVQQFPGKGNEDLSVFDPERWLVRKGNGEISFDGATRPQLGFGLGPRACWGRRLALLEMRIALSILVWKFDFLETPKELSGHTGVYDISYKAVQGYVRPRVRQLYCSHMELV